MTPRPLKYALSVLALAAFASPAQAALPSGNIVVNGGAEDGPGATNSTDAPAVPGWDTLPNFTAVAFGTSDFPAAGAGGSGANFFAGGPDNGVADISAATQRVDVSGAAPEIDQGNVQATLSGDLGGFGSQGDSASVTAVFTDNTGNAINGVLALEPVTPEQRENQTKLLPRSACVTLTPGARTLDVTAIMQRNEGPYNDGYADNLSVTLSTAPCPPADDAPLPPPAPPEPGVSGNASVVRGRVLVKRPGGSDYQELRAERSIPIGSEVDASKGTVALETASNASGGTQKGQFRDGAFILSQTRGRSPITDLTLSGRMDKCGSSRVRSSASRSRRLWGNGHGRFRTRGRNATATVRGTQWLLKDNCSSTTVKVARGTVIVRDLVKRKNIRVKAPHSYTARARRR